MGIVLRGGTIVNADSSYQAEVRLEGEKIAAIGRELSRPGDQLIEAGGCLLFPGGIDPHTHFDLDVGSTVTADDFFSGTRAAILGGTTTIIDFATQSKGESLTRALANWHSKAQEKSYCDYGFHLAITDWNTLIRQEMSRLIIEEGVTSFKLYLAYKNILQVDDGILLQALRHAKSCGALICLHCENGDVIDTLVQDARDAGCIEPRFHPLTRPPVAEQEACTRALILAHYLQAPVYIVHLSCAEALQVVAEAKARGEKVYAETCPQYLLLDDSYYRSPGFEGAKYVISPPLRQACNQELLWQGLESGILDLVATDHCSFNFKVQKELGTADFSKIPNGMPGVETRMGLLYTYGVLPGKISINKYVDLTSTRAAKLFGLYPRKGLIAPGSDADLVVWNPEADSVITAESQHMRVDYSPYEGFRRRGDAVHVFLRGRQVVREGQLIDPAPRGSYLYRTPFPKGGDDQCSAWS